MVSKCISLHKQTKCLQIVPPTIRSVAQCYGFFPTLSALIRRVPGELGVSLQKVLIEGPSGTADAPFSSALMLGLYSHNHLATSPIKN